MSSSKATTKATKASTATETTPLVPAQPLAKNKRVVFPFPLYLLPTPVHAYMELIRLDKRNGIWLVLWPYVLGMTFAAYRVGAPLKDYPLQFIQCVIGSVLSRSAACAVNDILDRKMDAGVERTSNRPMADGRISPFAGWTFVFMIYLVGTIFFRYVFTTSELAFWLAVIQMIPLFGLYPLFKRVTHFPQAWLGVSVQAGFVAGYVKITNELDWPLLSAYMVAGWCHTMMYDTIYACQDMQDDLKMGVLSTAIWFSKHNILRPVLVLFGVVFASGLAYVGYLNGQTPVFFFVGIGGTIYNLLWQARVVDLTEGDNCWMIFEANGQIGWIPWTGLMLDYLIKMGIIEFKINF